MNVFGEKDILLFKQLAMAGIVQHEHIRTKKENVTRQVEHIKIPLNGMRKKKQEGSGNNDAGS